MEDVAETGRSRRAILFRWAPLVLYAAAIFVASSIPGASMPRGGFWRIDKLIHALVFAGMGALGVHAFRRFWPAVAVCIAYGALDELHQSLTPGRSMDVRDFVADVVGALVGALAAWAILRRRPGWR